MGLKEWAEKNKAGSPGQLAKKEERVQKRADLKADWAAGKAKMAAKNKEANEAFAASNKETKEAFAANNKEAKEAFAGIKADFAANNKETKEARAIKADQAAETAGSMVELAANNKETKEAFAGIKAAWAAAKADQAAETAGSMAGLAAPKAGRVKAGNGQIVCPHCQVRGRVHTKRVKVKRGISGGKATGAVLTGGFSILATGLSRKENATQATCKNCHATWMF